jgi:hypothetical protein
MIDSFHPSNFSLILNLLDLTRHSRQLLAESYLEAGVSDRQNWDSELDFLSQADPGVTFQHAPDEDDEHDEDNDGDNDNMEEVIYGFVFQFSLLSSMLT